MKADVTLLLHLVVLLCLSRTVVPADVDPWVEFIRRMEAWNNALENDMSTLKQQDSALKDDVSVLKSENSDLQNDMSALKEQNSALKSDVSDLRTDNSALQNDVSDLKTDNSALQNDVSDLKTESSALQNDMSALKEQNSAFLARLSTLETKSDAAPLADCEDCEDCEKIYDHGSTQSGVYNIYHTSTPATPAKVYCDMDTDGGKWTVIQRRVDGSVDFYRDWAQYKAGFGDASGEYWLGLDNMHLLTKNNVYQLRVDMEDFEENTVFTSYSSFSVGSEADGYKLQVAGFQDGGAGDALTYHSGMKFSTFDKDQDTDSRRHCASNFSGAFWYKACHSANPNGLYLRGTTDQYGKGVNWESHWKNSYYSLKAIAMKIRRVS